MVLEAGRWRESRSEQAVCTVRFGINSLMKRSRNYRTFIGTSLSWPALATDFFRIGCVWTQAADRAVLSGPCSRHAPHAWRPLTSASNA